MLPPGRAFMVKGWNRSICMMTVLYAAYNSPELLEAIPADVKETLQLCMLQQWCWTALLWSTQAGVG